MNNADEDVKVKIYIKNKGNLIANATIYLKTNGKAFYEVAGSLYDPNKGEFFNNNSYKNSGYMLRTLDGDAKENFLSLVKALPKSEQIYYKREITSKEELTFFDELYLTADIMLSLENGKIYLIISSSGVENAYGLATMGKHWKPSFSVLGEKEPLEIGTGVRKNVRYATGFFPGTNAYHDIHQAKNLLPISAFLHDRFHSHHASRMGFIYEVTERMRMIIENEIFKYTAIKNSKQYWELTDKSFYYFADPNIKMENCKPCEIPEHFCNTSSLKEIIFGGDFQTKITDIGILVFIDMVKNKSTWLNYNFDPDNLVGTCKKAYEFVKQYAQYYTDNPISNIIKFRVFSKLTPDDDVTFWNEIINSSDFSKLVTYKRNNLENYLGLNHYFIDAQGNRKIGGSIETDLETFKIQLLVDSMKNKLLESVDESSQQGKRLAKRINDEFQALNQELEKLDSKSKTRNLTEIRNIFPKIGNTVLDYYNTMPNFHDLEKHLELLYEMMKSNQVKLKGP